MKNDQKTVGGLLCHTLFVLFLFGNLQLLAQWQNVPTSGIAGSRFANTWTTGAIANWTRSVGVGDFWGSGAYPNAHFHINSNYMLLPTNGSIASSGEVFRTDNPLANTSYWRMYRGATERFQISSDVANFVGLGTTSNESLRLFTQNISRVFINDNTGLTAGFVGIGNSFLTPLFRLHVDNGGILSTGNLLGSGVPVPGGLTGTRMMWLPFEGAFRAGDGGTAWDPGFVGDYSVAFGFNTEASGLGSVASGELNQASGDWSFAGGNANVASNNYSFAYGFALSATGENSVAFGASTQSDGLGAFSAGSAIINSGQFSYAFGEAITITPGSSFASGCGTGLIVSGVSSHAMGTLSQAVGSGSFVFGMRSRAAANNSYAIGTRMRALAIGSFTIGHIDTTAAYFLQNTIPRSLMIGFTSDRSTFFVGNSAGPGTTGRVGIGDLITMGGAPQNKLEINADALSPTPSGLRFTDLNSLSATVANPGLGVLALNLQGDVIYVPQSAGGGGDHDWYELPGVPPNNINDFKYSFGRIAIGTTAPLAQFHIKPGVTDDPFLIDGANARMNMLLGGNVGIGGLGNSTLFLNLADANLLSSPIHGLKMTLTKTQEAAIYVDHSALSSTAWGVLSAVSGIGSGTVYGFYADVVENDLATNHYGLFARTGFATTNNYGVFSNISVGGGTNAYAFYGNISAPVINSFGSYHTVTAVSGTTMDAKGFYANVATDNSATAGPTYVYGGYFKAHWGINTIGVYGEAVPAGSGTSLMAGGYFVGGLVSSMTPQAASDLAFKQDLETVTPEIGASVISSLTPRFFTYKTTGNAEYLRFPAGPQLGFVAQEAETFAPILVKDVTHPAQYDSTGVMVVPSFTYKSLDYEKIIPYIVADAQNKNNTIDSLEKVIGDLQDQMDYFSACLESLCGSESSMKPEDGNSNPSQSQNVTLSDVQSIVLDQNVPNPFAERTVISYYLPESVKQAQILFHDAQGKLINTTDISNHGSGQLNVYGSDLSSGIYTYTLIADGNIIDTKRMIKLAGDK